MRRERFDEKLLLWLYLYYVYFSARLLFIIYYLWLVHCILLFTASGAFAASDSLTGSGSSTTFDTHELPRSSVLIPVT